jgi:Phasin protein
MLIAEETLSNAFDFAQKLVSVREPQQLATLHSEFVGRQAQIFADQMKDVGQKIMHGTNDLADAAMSRTDRRKRSG